MGTMGKPSQQGKNPFEGMNFERMAPIYRGFGEFVDGLERHADGLSGPNTEQLKQHLKDLVKIYRDTIMPQLRTWISDANEKKTGFRVDFTHDQLMINWGNAPEPKFGSAGAPSTPDYAAAGESPHPILGDPNVRRAMAYAIDVQSAGDSQRTFALWGDCYVRHLAGEPAAWDPFASAVPDVVMPAYDPELAARLLDEAGWVMGPDGIRRAAATLYADPGPMLSFGELLAGKQPPATQAELDGLRGAVAELPGADPVSRAALYAAAEQSGYLADSPFAAAWSAELLHYNRKLFEDAGINYPPLDSDDWTWDKVVEVAKLLTVDEEGRNALDPNFDPARVVQHGLGSGVARPVELPVYDPKLLRAGDEMRRYRRWWERPLVRVGGAAAGIAIIAAGAFGGYQLFSGDGGTSNTVVANEGFRWSDGTPFTQADLDFAMSILEAEGWTFTDPGLIAVQDPSGDYFNTFTLDDTFTDPLVELTGGAHSIVTFPQTGGPDLSCGGTILNGMQIICAPGVSGALPAGDYVFVLGGVQNELSQRQAGREYRYNVFFEDSGLPLIFPDGDPRPEFPYNTLTRTNSYFELLAPGAGDWTLNGTYIDVPNQQSLDFTEDGPARDIAPNVRGAIGGNAFGFIVPVTWFTGPEIRFNVGTNVHTAGVEYAPDNVALDVLGETSLDDKPAFDPALIAYFAEHGQDTIELITARLPDWEQWVRSGNGAEVRSHLDQSAIEHWGADRCDQFFNNLGADDTFDLEVLDARGPVSWTWQIYGETVGTIRDAYEYDVSITQQGNTQEATVHFAWDDEKQDIRVFSPCITQAEATPAAEVPPPPETGGGVTADAEEALRSGMAQFAEARRAGDGDGYLALLHPIVLQFFGEDTCSTFYTSQVGPDASFAFGNVASITGPAPYNYVTNNGTAVGTADAYSVVAETTTSGGTQTFTWHFALVDGDFKIFQTCAR
jgi:hypothetical protein